MGSRPNSSKNLPGRDRLHCTGREGERRLWVKADRPPRWKVFQEGEWHDLHRVLWEQANGPLPAGYVLRSQYDPTDPAPANWQPVTRAEMMQRNQNRKKAGEKMRELWAVIKTCQQNGQTHQSGLVTRTQRRAA